MHRLFQVQVYSSFHYLCVIFHSPYDPMSIPTQYSLYPSNVPNVLDTTLSMTPTTAQEMFEYLGNQKTDRDNLKNLSYNI